MTIPHEFRRWVIPLAWLATAAITFSLGRFMSFIETPTTQPTTAAPRSTVSEPISASNAATTRDLAEATETHQSPIERLTGGQPMDEWLKRLLGQEDEIARMQGFLRLLQLLGTSEEIEQALNVLLANSNGWSRSKEFSMLLQKWAQFDPAKAMAFVDKIKDNGTKFGGYRAVLSTWTRRNAQEAIAWAEENGQPKDKDDRDGNWPMAYDRRSDRKDGRQLGAAPDRSSNGESRSWTDDRGGGRAARQPERRGVCKTSGDGHQRRIPA